ncbi:MAG: hypothetical protein E7331_09745 [Clostridiales bacterium]|nr:hypothetical protein [Clostridiales bacterium]
MNPLLMQAAKLLSAADFSWAVCGGFALELFLGRELRPHGDIDLCAFEADRSKIPAFMQKSGWQVYEFRGQGKVRLLEPGDASDPGRNLMCVLPGCSLVEFFPSEEEGLLYHQFYHTGLKELNYLEFLFTPSAAPNTYLFSANPPVSLPAEKALLRGTEGFPFLAPELALLYKALRPDEGPAASDYQAVYPRLSPSQKQWFQLQLKKLCPAGHPWME